MRILKLYIAIGLILALGMFFEIAAHAEDTNQEVTISFNAPVKIPGQVLPAGTYRFKPVQSDERVVRISMPMRRAYTQRSTLSRQTVRSPTKTW
jgi:hypothetical protein